MLSSSVASSHARVFVSQILNKSAYTHTHRHTEDRHMAKRCSKMLDTKRNLYLFLSFPQGLPPALTRRLSHCPLPSSWTWEPHGEAESQSLAQAWSGLSWSHNCGSLVNDRLRNLIPHTHTHTHKHIYTQTTPNPHQSLGFLELTLLSLHLQSVPTQTASCFWQPPHYQQSIIFVLMLLVLCVEH